MASDEFRHESIQDRQSIIKYLQAVTEGLERGHLELGNDDSELVLNPRGLIGLDVRGQRKSGRVKLTLKFSWREDDDAAGDGELTISSDRA
jgi:amphi-Trp domain-containing protein